MRNWPQTVLSQYSNSVRLVSLLSMIDQWISPDTNFEQFYDLVWNVDTAQGAGLDIWGRIVGVSRVVSLSSTNYFGLTSNITSLTGSVSGMLLMVTAVTGPITIGGVLTDTTGALVPGTLIVSQASGTPGGIGTYNLSIAQTVSGEAMFTSPVASGDPYNVSPFYDGNISTTNYIMADDAFRQLILSKAAANITNGSVQSINQILMSLFPGRGNAYVQDNLNMTMTYVFEFSLQPFEQAIVQSSGVLPRSTGVQANVSFL